MLAGFDTGGEGGGGDATLRAAISTENEAHRLLLKAIKKLFQ